MRVNWFVVFLVVMGVLLITEITYPLYQIYYHPYIRSEWYQPTPTVSTMQVHCVEWK